MGAAPAFQFYASDWAHSVSAMTLEERGAYITLLAWSWQHGPVPDDLKRIAAILGVEKRKASRIWSEIVHKWARDGEHFFVNKRLEAVRADSDAYRAKQAEKGRASAAARATAVPTTVQPRDQPEWQPEGNPPISTSDLRSLDQDLSEGRERPGPEATVEIKAITKVKSGLDMTVAQSRAGALVNGSAYREHGQHAWCSLPREGLCVLHTQHREMLGKSAKPEAELLAWYASTVARFEGRPIGEDRFTFWRNEFAAWIGTATAKSVEGKGHAAVSAARQTLLRRHPELGKV